MDDYLGHVFDKIWSILKQSQYSMDLTWADALNPKGQALRFNHPKHYPIVCYNNKRRILVEFEWENSVWGRQPAYEFSITEPKPGKSSGKRISCLQTAYVNPLIWSGDEQFWQLFTLCADKGANCPELQNRPRSHEEINKLNQ